MCLLCIPATVCQSPSACMIARSFLYAYCIAYFLEKVVGRDADVEEKGCQDDTYGAPFWRRCNVCRCWCNGEAAITNQLYDQADHDLSGSNRSNCQVQTVLNAVTDITKESVWFIIIYCFFTVGTVKFLQLSFVIFVGEELAEFGFVREECEKNFENHCSKSMLLRQQM